MAKQERKLLNSVEFPEMLGPVLAYYHHVRTAIETRPYPETTWTVQVARAHLIRDLEARLASLMLQQIKMALFPEEAP